MPTYGSLYKNIKERWPIFKEEPCNVRISMEADGVCNTLFPPVCKNNYIGQELWQTQRM